ncbi:hypothetical protein Cob_v012388 [Colletotrichum orbiculare MAFF 240422]|uniref:Uncharacterized protein n=1 Tax=Colletotrichum orbiculare (strain 104-T / ATCC 96160 / CBS 514.97 / LARS 414 / MAFF 240422) TaxID=1213857 RepID=A0A484F953_COLOR|nr:hypothetical protein Cob_v012388 [Colletotrichum orbiculare MAFF 240422]
MRYLTLHCVQSPKLTHRPMNQSRRQISKLPQLTPRRPSIINSFDFGFWSRISKTAHLDRKTTGQTFAGDKTYTRGET